MFRRKLSDSLAIEEFQENVKSPQLILDPIASQNCHQRSFWMTYEEIAKLAGQLSYRDKLRLAQLLIQFARKEEEEQNPENRLLLNHSSPAIQETVQYVAERLMKLQPKKQSSLLKSIGAMFQYQGGISEVEKEKIISELQRQRYITIDENNIVSYPK
jgi:hypothetical protein